SSLHTIPVRATYGWTPPDLLKSTTGMSADLFNPLLDSKSHKKIIDTYLPIQDLVYTPPATLLVALAQFKPHQTKEDNLLRSLQYNLSASFRPLDILAYEILLSVPESEAPCLLAMVKDLRSLLVHTSASITQSRNELAMQAFNPKFQVADPGSVKCYTMDPSSFQQSLSEQVNSQESVHKAVASFRKSRP
ncbi:hypothetical protein CLU79DRAFT_688005, partial [Phycomyces nitens]